MVEICKEVTMEKVSFWRWLRLVHSGADESSKRVYGGLSLIALIAILYLTGFAVIPVDIWTAIEAYVNTLTIVAASLLGLDTIKQGLQFFKREAKVPESKPEGKVE